MSNFKAFKSAVAQLKPTLKVKLRNRHAVFLCGADTQVRLREVFSYAVPRAQFSAAYRTGGWDGRRSLMSRGRVAAGLFLDMRKELEGEFALDVDDARVAAPVCLRERQRPGFEARRYQEECEQAMVSAGGTGGIVLMATGAGKTFLAGRYFKRLITPGLFICDELLLLEQSRQELESVLGEEVGVVGRSLFRPERITVATIQTLARHRRDRRFMKWFAQVDAVIIDEVHVAVNRSNIDVVTSVKPKAVFGLTATLQMDRPEVRMRVTALAGPVIYEYPIREGVAEGHLTRGVVCLVNFRDALPKPAPGYWTTVRRRQVWIKPWSRAAEYRYRVSLNRKRNDCVEKIVREGLRRGRRVIVLVEQIVHLKALSARLRDIKHHVVSGNEALSGKSAERLDAVRDMDAGRIGLILANRVFGKGINVKSCDMIVDATAKSGRDGAIQRYGRGVRTWEGKRSLLYVSIQDGGRFAGASKAREAALRETGAEVRRVEWRGNNAEEIMTL